MSQAVNGGPTRRATDQSTTELVLHASEQIVRLVREELELARAELTAKGRRAGKGAGMLGGAALLGFYGLGVLVIAAVLGLAVVVPGWLSALIIGVVLLLLAGLVAQIGRRQLRQPPVPWAAARSMREDLDTVTEAVRHRGEADATTGGARAGSMAGAGAAGGSGAGGGFRSSGPGRDGGIA